MIQKLKAYIRENQMLEEGDRILAGVSGGADSMCMLHCLWTLRESMGFDLEVAHVEHGIRGEAGRADAEFVRETCRQMEIRFHLVEADVEAMAKRERLSLEEAGRKVRYEAFFRILKERSGNKIAVAHNKNDQAETVLFHLFRGAGIRGLGGIRPVNGNIIRPLLCLTRREITDYLEENRIPYRTDATNEDTYYSRNRIRHEILPAAEQICSRAAEHMSDSAVMLRETDDYLREQAERIYEKYVTEGPEAGSVFLSEGLLEEPPALGHYLYLLCLERTAGKSRDISAVHVRDTAALMERQPGRSIDLPCGMNASRRYGGILLRQCDGGNRAPDREETQDAAPRAAERIKIEAPGEYCFSGPPGARARIRLTVCEKKENQEIPQKSYTKWFDYDKIKFGLSLRRRQPGDYLTLGPKGGRQKLKAFFINEKVPSSEREKIWLLADGPHVLWIIGYRISEYYKVTEHTKRILEVQVDKGEEDE